MGCCCSSKLAVETRSPEVIEETCHPAHDQVEVENVIIEDPSTALEDIALSDIQMMIDAMKELQKNIEQAEENIKNGGQGGYIPQILLIPKYLRNTVLNEKDEKMVYKRVLDNGTRITVNARHETHSTRGFHSGIMNGKLIIKVSNESLQNDYIQDEANLDYLSLFPAVDIHKTLAQFEETQSSIQNGIQKEDLIMAPVGVCADCIASWRWDFHESTDNTSVHVVKTLRTARQMGFQYILFDCVSVDQNSGDIIKLIIEYGKFYNCLPTVRSYDLLQLVDGTDFKLNDFVRPWIYIENSRNILQTTFQSLGDFPLWIKFRFLIEVFNLIPKSNSAFLEYGIESINDESFEQNTMIEISVLELEEKHDRLQHLKIGELFRQPINHARHWSSSAGMITLGIYEIATKLPDLVVIRLLLSPLPGIDPELHNHLINRWKNSDLTWNTWESRLKIFFALNLYDSMLNPEMELDGIYVSNVDIVDPSTYAGLDCMINTRLGNSDYSGIAIVNEEDPEQNCIMLFRGYDNLVLRCVYMKKKIQQIQLPNQTINMVTDYRLSLFNKLGDTSFKIAWDHFDDDTPSQLRGVADSLFQRFLISN